MLHFAVISQYDCLCRNAPLSNICKVTPRAAGTLRNEYNPEHSDTDTALVSKNPVFRFSRQVPKHSDTHLSAGCPSSLNAQIRLCYLLVDRRVGAPPPHSAPGTSWG
jgi:hypothetical protein